MIALAMGWENLFSAAAAQLEDLRLVVLREGEDAPDFGALAGQRAGLVKQERIDFAHRLERAAGLDQHTLLRGERQRRQHGDRRGHANAGAEIAVDHSDGAISAAHGEAQRAERQGRADGAVGELLTPGRCLQRMP